MSNFVRFPVWATLFTIMGVLVLCTLGTWQVQRLHWKENILTRLQSAYDNPNPPFMRVEDIETLSRVDYPYARVRLRGEYAATAFRIGPRMKDGKPGYHLYMPLLLKTGGAVLVNRGWLAQDAAPPAAEGPVAVTGLLRPVTPLNTFSARNDPAADKWYRLDIEEMKTAAALPVLAPLVLDEDTLRWLPPNNHLYYAFFWFSMAVALIVIYGLRFFYRQRSVS